MVEVQRRHAKDYLMIRIRFKVFSYGAWWRRIAGGREVRLTDITIRDAAETDISAIAAIYSPAVLHGTASFEIDPPDEMEMLRRFRAIRAGGYPYLAATRDGALVGYAYASAYRPRPAYRHTVENSIYVAPEGQRGGVGRALMAALIAECEIRGFRQMIAGIGDSANDSSIGLHRALGFELVGIARSVGWKHGRWLDHVLMQRPLGPGDSTPPPSGAP
jgi:L-amino acid N-acyltransferase YncA